MENMKKFKTPIRTEIVDTYGFEISIIGETKKAYLVILSKSVRKGTSKFFKRKEIEKWIPKSVWDNDNNFMQHSENSSQIIFNTPYFLR
jgi:hypothetical protein